ncbi:hypothetical protein J2Z22_003080 [Paenibacillus forsythiae]|uniref:Uncharacterized protein n=1 Tax=Paenibacillus forsythiae TaxID=365616 RepID=A0ABU3HBX7_9BACL|nr:hypothetical protein [Paenibacillus forsythiae]MDT3427517.1 hypothetical protein [Paenibacillus forsythiae]
MRGGKASSDIWLTANMYCPIARWELHAVQEDGLDGLLAGSPRPEAAVTDRWREARGTKLP